MKIQTFKSVKYMGWGRREADIKQFLSLYETQLTKSKLLFHGQGQVDSQFRRFQTPVEGWLSAWREPGDLWPWQGWHEFYCRMACVARQPLRSRRAKHRKKSLTENRSLRGGMSADWKNRFTEIRRNFSRLVVHCCLFDKISIGNGWSHPRTFGEAFASFSVCWNDSFAPVMAGSQMPREGRTWEKLRTTIS